jgi:hypothetical protein
MSIIKETIKYIPIPTGTTQIIATGHPVSTGITGIININFGISAEDGFLGLQQEIDNLTEVVGLDVVNPELDVEQRKIKYKLGITPITLQFWFHVPNTGNSWVNDFYTAGFKTNDIFTLTQRMLNSCFIMDFYDTYDTNTQTKIFSTYLTKLIGNDAYGNKVYTPNYTIGGGAINQLYYWYVPVWYLTGSTITGYTKFTFYNAISGKTALFYNPDNDTVTPQGYVNPQKMYLKSIIDVRNKTWQIQTSSFPTVRLNQLWSSTAYSDKVDNTVQNFKNEAQDYPSGSTFNYVDGKYSNA